jgi:hypothetical protein
MQESVAMPPRYRFGVSEFTTTPWTFEQDVEAYAQLGVEAMEVCEFKLDERRRDEQLALIAKQGLVTSVPLIRGRPSSPSLAAIKHLSERTPSKSGGIIGESD